jgi:hypothetical protein
MTRLLGAFGLVAGIVLLLVLAGWLTGVWSSGRAPERAAASTKPVALAPAAPQRSAGLVRPKRRHHADAARSAKRRWIRAANAICLRAGRESAALTARLSEQRELAGLARLAEAERRVEARALAELRRLRPAPGDAFAVSRLVAAGRRRDRIERQVVRSVRTRDLPAAVGLAPELELAQRQFGAIAAALGADACGGADLGALATTALDGVAG